jgi:hypothetical protein
MITSTLNPQPSTPNPKPQTPNPHPATVLDGVASGTFIYISTVDLIAEEIAGRGMLRKYLALLVGFFFFVVLSAAFHQPH